MPAAAAPEVKVPAYRLIADLAERGRLSLEFGCANDEDAVLTAMASLADHAMELWQGNRLVARLSAAACRTPDLCAASTHCPRRGICACQRHR
jgi:hypothetical protein